jgi:STE24 endopeptidase
LSIKLVCFLQSLSPIFTTNRFVDEFAHNLGYKVELAQALIKLQIKNLSSMDADHLYSSYHYSHPILPERLSALGWDGSEKVPEKVSEKTTEPAEDVKASGREL